MTRALTEIKQRETWEGWRAKALRAKRVPRSLDLRLSQTTGGHMSQRTAQTRAFVHSLASSQLHGLAFKLSRDARARDWSDAQEGLFQRGGDEVGGRGGR